MNLFVVVVVVVAAAAAAVTMPFCSVSCVIVDAQ